MTTRRHAAMDRPAPASQPASPLTGGDLARAKRGRPAPGRYPCLAPVNRACISGRQTLAHWRGRAMPIQGPDPGIIYTTATTAAAAAESSKAAACNRYGQPKMRKKSSATPGVPKSEESCGQLWLRGRGPGILSKLSQTGMLNGVQIRDACKF